MKRVSANLSLGVLLAFTVSARSELHAGPKSAQFLTIGIRTYTYAQVSPTQLAQAKAVAARILDRAGIHTVWVDCRLATEAAQGNPKCDQTSGPPIAYFNISLVDRFPPEAKITGARTLGFAILPEQGAFGDLVYISLPNIEKYRDEQRAPLDLVLGLVLAHEIGHLLIGLNEHAPTGIMRAYWEEADLQRAQWGEIQFTAEQGELLRARAQARTRRESSEAK